MTRQEAFDEIQDELYGLLLLKNNYKINIIDNNFNIPEYISSTNTINIGNCELWKQIYQLSHELLHAAFQENCNNKNNIKYRWIEEILCESFSIYCLKRFCRNTYKEWKLYLRPYMYYLIGNCKTREIISSEEIISIKNLNEKLTYKKSYETLQFIHPLCLLIVNVIEYNICLLQDIFDYTKYIDKNDNFIECNNEIIMLIKDFIIYKNLV